jgi:hypothetical protein
VSVYVVCEVVTCVRRVMYVPEQGLYLELDVVGFCEHVLLEMYLLD